MTDSDTTEFETRLTDGLIALAQAPAPPSTVDAGLARSRGLRAVRRRRIALAGTAAVIAMAVGLSGVALARTGGRETGVPDTGIPDTQSTRGARSGADPLLDAVVFGWLPQPMTGGLVQSSEDDSQGTILFNWAKGKISVIEADVENPGTTLPSPPAGPLPPGLHGLLRAHAVSAPLVNGQPSQWIVDPHGKTFDNDVVLRWRLADGRQAQVRLTPPPGADFETMRAQTLHVAQTLRFPAKPAGRPLPFYLTGLPHGAKLVSVEFTKGMPGAQSVPERNNWQIVIRFTLGTPVTELMQWMITPYRAGLDHGAGDLCESHLQLNFCVDSSIIRTAEAMGGAPGLLKHRLTLLGLDPSAWTTHVLR